MGNWGPELVDAAGAELALGERGQYSFAVPFDRLRDADPEFLIVAPCGFQLERSIQEAPVLARYPGWTELGSVRDRKVVFADGNLFFNRSGMTAVRTAELLAEIFHGLISGERTEGRHWIWSDDIGTTRTTAA
jgi:iron complex transport system substrate-binding protein